MSGARWRLLFLPVCVAIAWLSIAPLAARGDNAVPVAAQVTDAESLARLLNAETYVGVAPVVPATGSPSRVDDVPAISGTSAIPTTTSPPASSPLFEPVVEVAGATTIARNRPPEVELGERALLRMNYQWSARFPDWTIEFLGPRQGLRALTYPSERRIEVFVRPQDDEASLHRVIAHEVGHLVDVSANSQDDRDRWSAQRNIEGADWWPSEAQPDFATGAGDFAEAFAVWETGIQSRSTIAGQPDEADLALLAELAN